MTNEFIALIMMLIMLFMIFIRIPIGVAMMLSGIIGYSIIDDFSTLLFYLKSSTFAQIANNSFSVIPLFLLMGNLASHSGLSKSLFDGVNAFIGHRRGGLALATIGGCGLFGAICGSSLATAATMGQVALPEMRRHGYNEAFSTGALAAGGTLGILIPPSIVLIIYALLTEQNIAKLFLAAMIPGIMAVIGYLIVILIIVKLHPDYANCIERKNWAEKMRAIINLIPACFLFIVVLGGIYIGFFTPTEAASFGVMGTILIAFINKKLTLDICTNCLTQTAINTGMIFLIIIGADIFNVFLSLSGVTQFIVDGIIKNNLSPMMVMITILLVYLFLGCLMDSLSMILLTVPILFPAIMALDFGMTAENTALWFGIICLIVVEVGMITPPVGLNVFIINKLAKNVSMKQTFQGVLPFLASDFIRVILLLCFPILTWGIVTA